MDSERRDIVVKVSLSASEYLALSSMCSMLGIAHSAYLRMLLLKECAQYAADKAKQEGQD